MLAGKIGSRSEKIGSVRVVVARPPATMRATPGHAGIPEVHAAAPAGSFPHVPAATADRLGRRSDVARRVVGTVVDVPALRPTVDQREPTSTLLHELAHIALGIRGDEESDWIVEGLAEYYSLETLRRSGGISEQRYKQALKHLSQWARRSPTLFASDSNGATTARAVLALRASDAEIRSATGGKASLDDVARKLAEERGK